MTKKLYTENDVLVPLSIFFRHCQQARENRNLSNCYYNKALQALVSAYHADEQRYLEANQRISTPYHHDHMQVLINKAEKNYRPQQSFQFYLEDLCTNINEIALTQEKPDFSPIGVHYIAEQLKHYQQHRPHHPTASSSVNGNNIVSNYWQVYLNNKRELTINVNDRSALKLLTHLLQSNHLKPGLSINFVGDPRGSLLVDSRFQPVFKALLNSPFITDIKGLNVNLNNNKYDYLYYNLGIERSHTLHQMNMHIMMLREAIKYNKRYYESTGHHKMGLNGSMLAEFYNTRRGFITKLQTHKKNNYFKLNDILLKREYVRERFEIASYVLAALIGITMSSIGPVAALASSLLPAIATLSIFLTLVACLGIGLLLRDSLFMPDECKDPYHTMKSSILEQIEELDKIQRNDMKHLNDFAEGIRNSLSTDEAAAQQGEILAQLAPQAGCDTKSLHHYNTMRLFLTPEQKAMVDDPRNGFTPTATPY